MEHGRPDQIAVAIHHGVCTAEFVRFFGVQCRVNSSEDYISAATARHSSDLVTTQRVPGVDADADSVAFLDLSGSIGFSVSSTSTGSPKELGLAAAMANNHRGVITAVPNDTSLGLTG